MTIRFASFLGDNALEFYRQIVDYLGTATGLEIDFVADLTPIEQEAMVQREEIQVVFTCGLPYVHKADQTPSRLKAMVAPVLEDQRYDNQPVYYSDVIVRADSAFQSLDDLQGTTFAFNEVHSLSGYVSMCHHLFTKNESFDFFDVWLKSGAHAVSMDWVEQGRVDAAAVDSVVLSMEVAQHPERANVFRVVEHIGPCPMPPVAAVAGLDRRIRQQLTQALATMHLKSAGRTILYQGGVKQFTAVQDRDYDPIRHIVQDLRESRMIDFQ